jgi:hypothetical protein
MGNRGASAVREDSSVRGFPPPWNCPSGFPPIDGAHTSRTTLAPALGEWRGQGRQGRQGGITHYLFPMPLIPKASSEGGFPSAGNWRWKPSWEAGSSVGAPPYLFPVTLRFLTRRTFIYFLRRCCGENQLKEIV